MSRGINSSTIGAACCALVALAGVASFATTPSPVSPGDNGRFARIEARCPSFSWTFLPAASSVEIAVFAQPQGASASTFDPEAAELVLLQRLPGATSSWTPSLDRCLELGRRYAWYVRALHEAAPTSADVVAGDEHAASQGSEASATDANVVPAPWSKARLFEVRERAPEEEVAEAIEVVRRYLRERGELPGDLAGTPPVDLTDRRREIRRAPETADRPEVARGGESAIPEREESAAGSEPTIVLGGDPVARLAASDLVRNSADPEVFDFKNPGVGTMTVRVDGVEVVTTATDQDTTYLAGNQLDLNGVTFDVVEGSGMGLDADLLDGMDSSDFVATTGDTMTGLLTIDPASGHALTTGSGDSINLGGNVFLLGTLFLHAGGFGNTGAGLGALQTSTGGGGNTAMGASALHANTSGSHNTAVGSSALIGNSSGSSNTALGSNALAGNEIGSSNTAIGRSALLNNTASSNTAVGAYALDDNTSGSSNTALGSDALGENELGSSNTAVGRSALLNNTASLNTAVGSTALDENTSGASNTAVGVSALGGNETGSTNTAVGRSALLANDADDNTAVGAFALDSNTSGTANIAIGFEAGENLTTGSDNIAIGNAGVAGESGKIRIGSTQTETFIAGIHGNTATGGIAVIVNSSGELGTTTSSRRFKEDIRGLGEATEPLLALRPVSFRYTREAAGEGERPIEYGLIAEEVAEVLPDLVVFDDSGAPYTVRYHLLVPLLLAELQRQRAEIDELRRSMAGSTK